QGSALTYAKRYSLAAAFGISSDIDDDGNGASNNDKPNTNNQTGSIISPKQIGMVKSLFNQFATLTKADVKKVSEFALSHYKITKLENATSSQASALIKYMEEQIAKKQDDGQ
ncbi:ERF family protein, partial [Carnobacterium maltaromaticum]